MTFRQKKFCPPKFHPSQGVKRPQNAPSRVKRYSSPKKFKNDNAPQNGSNSMYNGLVKAFFEFLTIYSPYFCPSQGVKHPKNDPFRVKNGQEAC